MAETSRNDARVRGLPLSSSMRTLLGDLLLIIDKRLFSLSEAELWAEQEGDRDLIPATCEACYGTGIFLVEQEDAESHKGKRVAHGSSKSTHAAISGSSSSGSSVSTPGAPVLGSTSLPSITSLTSSVPAVTITSSSSPSTTTTSSSTTRPHITPSVVGAAAATVISAVRTPSVTTTSGGAAPLVNTSLAVPPPSVVIPVFQSLGENHPVPDPQDAVFCTQADGPPFYTVTRGKHVGCFGGWDMVSPYVVKAGGVAYGKKPSLITAYDAYTKAHSRGAISYT